MQRHPNFTDNIIILCVLVPGTLPNSCELLFYHPLKSKKGFLASHVVETNPPRKKTLKNYSDHGSLGRKNKSVRY